MLHLRRKVLAIQAPLDFPQDGGEPGPDVVVDERAKLFENGDAACEPLLVALVVFSLPHLANHRCFCQGDVKVWDGGGVG